MIHTQKNIVINCCNSKPRPSNHNYSARRAAARLNSAHARNFQGCMICIMGVGLHVNRGCTCHSSTAKGYSTNITYLVITCNKPQQQIASSGTHMMTNSSSKQPRCSCSDNSLILTHREESAAEVHRWGRYTYSCVLQQYIYAI